MKKILILILSGLFLIPAFAQKSKKDIVYLKSGGIIKGQLITHDLDIVKINSSGNQWVFKTADVDSVSKYSQVVRETSPNQNYFFDTSMGVLIGNSGNGQKAPFSFMASFNHRVIDKLYLGAGLGTEFFDESYMPVFGQVQYRFRDTKFTPFFNLQVGYEVGLEDGISLNYTNFYPQYSDYRPNQQTGE